MISFVCWLWNTPGYRTRFTAEHVNTLSRMISKHYDAPHTVACVTNHAAGIDPAITIIPDRADFAAVLSPHGGGNPSCYRRLRMYAADAAETFGDRIVSIDLDAVITDDLRPVVDRPEDFVGWSDVCRPTQHCGSLTLLRAGSRPQVWTDFDPATSPHETMAAKCMGSDQGWVSHCLPNEPQWTQADGVYNWRFDLKGGALPANARVVFFTGSTKPWDPAPQLVEWVRTHWR